MKNKYVFTAAFLALITICCALLTQVYLNQEEKETATEETYTVVTSFYPMYIAAMNVVGDNENITLENLSEPQTGCLHDYQLTPADMKLLSTADVFIVNGGGIESFLSDVAEQYPNLVIINACDDVDLIEDNAHAWMNMEDYMTQVQTMAEGLGAVDTADASTFSSNADAYCAKVQELVDEAEELKSETEGQNIVIFHEAYEYLAQELGMNVTYTMDLDEERQVSAGEVADVLEEIADNGVTTIFAEELYGKDMGDTVEKESDATVLYLNTLVRGDYDADSYLDGMKENLQLIKEAFAQ